MAPMVCSTNDKAARVIKTCTKRLPAMLVRRKSHVSGVGDKFQRNSKKFKEMVELFERRRINLYHKVATCR